MKELDISSLTEPPEFEKRCNAFVAEVTLILQQKYPDLYIEAENQTLAHICELPEKKQLWKEAIPSEDRESFIRASERLARRAEIESTFLNFATVDIWDFESKGRKEMIKKAIKWVKKIAKKYHPEKEFIDTYYAYQFCPGAHLAYFFS